MGFVRSGRIWCGRFISWNGIVAGLVERFSILVRVVSRGVRRQVNARSKPKIDGIVVCIRHYLLSARSMCRIMGRSFGRLIDHHDVENLVFLKK